MIGQSGLVIRGLNKKENIQITNEQIYVIGIYPLKTDLFNSSNGPRVIGFVSDNAAHSAIRKLKNSIKLPDNFRYEAIRLELYRYDIRNHSITAVAGGGVWAYEQKYLETKIKNWFPKKEDIS